MSGPGASGPGQPGYEGEVTVGDDGAVPNPLSYVSPDEVDDVGEEAIPQHVKEAWARADERTERTGGSQPPDPAA